MQNFTTLIINKISEANLFASQGGPVILAQVYHKIINDELVFFNFLEPNYVIKFIYILLLINRSRMSMVMLWVLMDKKGRII